MRPDGGDHGVKVVAGAFQGGLGGFQFGGGGVALEDGEFAVARGGEPLGGEGVGAGEIEQRRLGGDLRAGHALDRGIDGLVLGEFLLGDLGGERFDPAFSEVATAFDGFALGFEVCDQIRIVVLDLDDEVALFHTLSFHDVQMFHAPGDLCFHVDAPVQRVESDHFPHAADELSPRQEEQRHQEDDEAENEHTAEDVREAGGPGEGERGERWGDGECRWRRHGFDWMGAVPSVRWQGAISMI